MNDESRDREVSTDPDEWVSIDYVHDQVEVMISRQWDSFQAWERRFGQVLAFASTFTVAGLAFLPDRIVTNTLSKWLTFAGLAILLVSCAVTLIWGLLPTGWVSAPDPRILRERYLTTDPREIRLIVTDSRVEYFELNKERLDRKVWLFGLSVGMLLVGIFLLLLATVASVTLDHA